MITQTTIQKPDTLAATLVPFMAKAIISIALLFFVLDWMVSVVMQKEVVINKGTEVRGIIQLFSLHAPVVGLQEKKEETPSSTRIGRVSISEKYINKP